MPKLIKNPENECNEHWTCVALADEAVTVTNNLNLILELKIEVINCHKIDVVAVVPHIFVGLYDSRRM